MSVADQDKIEIERAYRFCENVTKIHAKSFYFAAKFLPKSKRRAVYPIYAFCRRVDDEIDEIGEGREKEAIRAIEKWRGELKEVYENENQTPSGNAENENRDLVFIAWRDLLKTYKIPSNLPLELMQGVVQDTQIKRYETFAELYVYCYRVASTVGLMSSEILGYKDAAALEYAEAMGIAMQLTNILRDIKEDAAIGRIYLPQEDLRRFSVSEEQISAGVVNDNFIEMMRFQIERARNFYRTGEKGIRLLEKDSRLTVLLAARIYSRILDEIERQNYDVFARRASTTFAQKMFSIPKIWREAKSIKDF